MKVRVLFTGFVVPGFLFVCGFLVLLNFREDGGFGFFVCFVYLNKGGFNSCLRVACIQYWQGALKVHLWGERQRSFYVRFKQSRRERKVNAQA